MSVLATYARRRAASSPDAWPVAPFAVPAITPNVPVMCDLPPYAVNGNLNTIHPSVWDFGTEWNGYRWWMANTPYPPDEDEQPVIYASNDMLTWVTPPGLVNPIDPFPGSGGYNSDVELTVGDDGSLICFYREVPNGIVGDDAIRARYSTNGVDWSDEIAVCTLKDLMGRGGGSPAIVKVGPDDWRMWVSGLNTLSMFTAPDPINGPWSFLGHGSGILGGYHGDVIKYKGWLLAAWTGDGAIYTGKSMDGLAWAFNPVPLSPTTYRSYRCTITLSPEPGWVDVWSGGTPIPPVTGPTRTWYTRVPLSAFGVA